MEYRRLGRSGMTISAIGMGCNPFGIEVDYPTTERIVHRAVDLGVTYFDTADSYSRGVSEDFVGRALDGRRGTIVLATKFANAMGDGPNMAGTSRKHIVAACEASLKRLRTDYIDVYQIHDPDRRTPIEETLQALDTLVRDGKVRYVGCSNFFEWEICEALWAADRHGLTRFVSAQDHYNLLYRDIEKRMEPFCLKYGIGMIAYFPLAGAMLTGAYRRGVPPAPGSRGAGRATFKTWDTPVNWDIVEALAAFAETRGWSLPQLALAFLLSRPMTATVIPGADREAHIEANIKALEVKLSAEDLAEIDRITLVHEDRTRAPIYAVLRPSKGRAERADGSRHPLAVR